MAISVTKRATKGSPLDATEHDANLTNICAAIENTSTGHDHDGTDSKAITKENVTGLKLADSPTFTGETLSGLTASLPVFTNGSKALVSNVMTGTGSVVMSASPALTGTPTAPTAAANTSTTQIATTAFAKGEDATISNPKAMSQAVALTAAASGSSGIVVADNANINPGTGNFALVWKGSLPDWTPATPQSLIYKRQTGDINYLLSVNADGKIRAASKMTTYVFDATSTVAPILTDGTSHEIMAVVVREIATVAGSVTFYVDKVQLGSTVAIPAAATVSITNTGPFYVMGSDVERYAGTCQSAYFLNFAPTAAEVLSMQNGIPESWKWGSQTAVYTSNFSAGVDGWNDNNSDLTGNKDTISDGTTSYDDCLEIIANSTGYANMYRLANALYPFKKWQINFDVYIPATNVTGVKIAVSEISGTPVYYSPGNTWYHVSQTVTGTVSSGIYPLIALADVTNRVSNGITVGDKYYIKNIVINIVGATLALEPEGVQPAPGQWLDSSTNKLHAVQPAAGSSIVRRKKDFEVRSTHTWAGTHEVQYLGGINQSVLPPGNIRIDYISGIANAALGLITVTIGDGSDVDRFVTNAVLTSGFNDFTLASRYHDGTNMKLTIDPTSNATGTITMTVKGIILE